MGPHAAVLGMKFYNRDLLIEQGCAKNIKYPLFPSEYNNAIFLAQHGSWSGGYQLVLGYKVNVVKVSDSGDTVNVDSFEDFATGFRENGHSSTILSSPTWARPAFIEILYDGSMLISDDREDYIFRITYTGSDATTYDCPTPNPTMYPTIATSEPTMTSDQPSRTPSKTPSKTPSNSPSKMPLTSPGNEDSTDPTQAPSMEPTTEPIMKEGTEAPTQSPEIDTLVTNVDKISTTEDVNQSQAYRDNINVYIFIMFGLFISYLHL